MQFILILHIINSYSKQVGTGFFFSSFWITSTEYWLVFNVLLPADPDAEARGFVLSERGLFQQQRWMTKRRAGRWWAGGDECQGWAILLVISREEAGNTGELEKARSRELSRETPEISARETTQKVASKTQTSTNSHTRSKKHKILHWLIVESHR